MSGAEFVAVLSIGASVIAVVDACNKLRNRIKEFEDDQTLRELAAQLRLFANGIEILRQQHAGEDLDALTQDALIEVLDCCGKRIKELDVLIVSALPTQKNTGFKRTRAAIRNLRDNKRVRDILNSLQRCQQLLVFHMASVSKRRQRHQAQDPQSASERHDFVVGLLRNLHKAAYEVPVVVHVTI
ncbi:Ankyrin repeat protein [Lasiodiplodia theobromae]|uniref:Ankyrin repeat protein n=1 Tax=Lasiodiplodia theobromae TaxID=45133 RepID=UPI0015C39374|nr:Ankyrin repeat protein [Lasiodiplodia theobromae]KAF4543384.1 Ankyrin repeat protein [Lasiodiplodia theobromae]